MIPAFKEITGSSIILSTRQGWYISATAYELNGLVFARVGNRFVKLYANGASTNPNYRWQHIDLGTESYGKDAVGCLAVGEAYAALPEKKTKRLLAAVS